MNTKDLEMYIRDQLLEYQKDPFDSPYIVNMLNEAYHHCYMHVVRANDTMFGQEHPWLIVSGQSEYDMPTELWGKRIESIWIPSPPNEGQAPWGWFKLEKVDYKQSWRIQSNRIRTYYPSGWSQLNNKIYVFPLPIVNYPARMIISRKLPTLGVYCGRITAMNSVLGVDSFTLDEIYDERVDEKKGDSSQAFISVSSFRTGEIKAMYAYSAVDTLANKITLAAAPVGRTTFQAYPISALPAGDFGEIELDDIVTFGYTTGKSILGESFDYLLCNWAALRIHGILSESDAEQMNALKLQLADMVSDLAGRDVAVKKERSSYRQASSGFRPFRRRG